jgi:hypothetical protein
VSDPFVPEADALEQQRDVEEDDDETGGPVARRSAVEGVPAMGDHRLEASEADVLDQLLAVEADDDEGRA